MNFFDSIKIVLIVQTIVGMKHYQYSKKDNKFFLDHKFLKYSWIIFTLIFVLLLLLYVYIAFTVDFDKNRNPVDRGLLTTIVIIISMQSSVISVIISWFISIKNASKECDFYQKFNEIDKMLAKVVNLQEMYRKFWTQTKMATMCLAIPNIIAFISLYVVFDGVVFKVSNIFLLLFLGQYATTYSFCWSLYAIQMRFDLISKQTKKSSLNKHQYITLVKAATALTQLIKNFNESFGVKQAPILCSNFLNAISLSYGMFLAILLKQRTIRQNTYVAVGSKVLIPHYLMMTVVFVIGDCLKCHIYGTLLALTKARTRNCDVRHLQRRLLFVLKSVKHEITIFKLISLNLKVFAKGVNMIVIYFVIILQFKFLTDDL